MKRRFLGIATISALSFAVGSLWGHHTTETYFDLSTTYILKGVITSVAWRNPHMYAFMDVTTCKADNWAVELGSLPEMTRAGLARDTLQKGMPVSIYAAPAKFASTSGLPEADAAWKERHFVLGGCMTLPDGKQIEYSDGPRCKRPAKDIPIGVDPR